MTSDELIQADSRTVLCPLDAIAPGSSRGFQVGNASCFAVRDQDGEIYVYRNSCPHLGVELEWVPDQFLDSEGVLIQCATHGALFLMDSGQCVSGPCLGDSLQTIPYILRDGMLEVDAVALSQGHSG